MYNFASKGLRRPLGIHLTPPTLNQISQGNGKEILKYIFCLHNLVFSPSVDTKSTGLSQRGQIGHKRNCSI